MLLLFTFSPVNVTMSKGPYMKRPTRVWGPSSVAMTSLTRWLAVTFYIHDKKEHSTGNSGHYHGPEALRYKTHQHLSSLITCLDKCCSAIKRDLLNYRVLFLCFVVNVPHLQYIAPFQSCLHSTKYFTWASHSLIQCFILYISTLYTVCSTVFLQSHTDCMWSKVGFSVMPKNTLTGGCNGDQMANICIVTQPLYQLGHGSQTKSGALRCSEANLSYHR